MTVFVVYRKSDGRIVSQGTGGKNSSPVEDRDFGVLEVAERLSGLAKVVDGTVVYLDDAETEVALFPVTVKRARAYVSQRVAVARGRFITALPGQDAIYQAKENEAIAYLAATNPVLTDYPLLNAETGITAPTATELANLWLTMAQQWRSVAAQLEAARMTANASIGSATTVVGVDVALEALDAALAGLPQP